MNYLISKIKRIHFIGIAGIGMSGIAELLSIQGFKVSGSDLRLTSITKHLEDCGCKIYPGHSAENLKEKPNAVVYSSAVSEDNVEIVEARRLGIPVIRRAEMLAEIMRMKTGIAISGTHGKTTTTSILGEIITHAQMDPTVIVGGVLRGLGTNARLGNSHLLIAEADEFDRSFLKLTPTIALVTTIEEEHLDTYKNFNEIKEAFLNFANSVPFYGLVAVCLDEKNLVSLLPEITRPVVTYGLTPNADIYGKEIPCTQGSKMAIYARGSKLGEIEIPLVGVHNMRNVLGAITISLELGVSFEIIKQALAEFAGVKRRFEKRGEFNGIDVIDDYAHHPTEVKMTLEAARKVYKKRIIAVFQPHLFSRTKRFYPDFARSLLAADVVYITDIYPAREKPMEGVNSEMIIEKAHSYGHKEIYKVKNRKELVNQLIKTAKPGDVIITLGAGDVYQVSDNILEKVKLQ